MNKAVLVDRDGTLNVELGRYAFDIKDFGVYPEVIKGMKLLSKTDYKLIMITNQQGIGKGRYTKKDAMRFNEHLKKFIEDNGGRINGIYFCPHLKEHKCSCRKPEIGMIMKAKEDFNLDLEKCFVIGDKTTDIEMGKRANCKTILVKTGYKGEDRKVEAKPDFVADDFLQAANIVIQNE